jgi:hypothetical protein
MCHALQRQPTMTQKQQSIQKKYVLQTTQTATECQTTKKISLYIIAVSLGLTAPFWHIIYGISKEEGIFGYPFMSSFLYAFGNPVFMISAGLLTYYISSKASREYRLPFKIISYMMLFVGCFFMIHIFLPKKLLFNKADFPVYYYWISMLAMVMVLSRLLTMLQKAVIITEEKLKKNIRDLISFIFKSTPKKHEEEMWNVLEDVSNE